MNQQAEVATIKEKQTPIKLGITNAALTKLENEYKEVPDANTNDGYKAIVEAKRVLTPIRTAVEAERKVQVASAVEHQRRVNSVAKQIVTRIKAIEEPLYNAKNEVDERAAREKREAEEKDERRILAIESAVEDIHELTADLLGASLEMLEERLSEANNIVISDGVYQEFIEPASQALDKVKTQLTNAVTTAKALLVQQEEIDCKQKILDEAEQAQIKADAVRQRQMDEKQAELDRRQKEFDDREADRLAEIARQEAETKRLEEEKAEEIRLAEEQEEADKQRIIHERETDAEMAARMPQDLKLRAWIDNILIVEPPDVEDAHLCAILRDGMLMLSDLNKMVYEGTQSPVESE